jgi:hypothetical protein
MILSLEALFAFRFWPTTLEYAHNVGSGSAGILFKDIPTSRLLFTLQALSHPGWCNAKVRIDRKSPIVEDAKIRGGFPSTTGRIGTWLLSKRVRYWQSRKDTQKQ